MPRTELRQEALHCHNSVSYTHLDASGGKCKLFSGYDEIKRSLTGSRTQGFYDENDKITIDDNIKTYMETAKTPVSYTHLDVYKRQPGKLHPFPRYSDS